MRCALPAAHARYFDFYAPESPSQSIIFRSGDVRHDLVKLAVRRRRTTRPMLLPLRFLPVFPHTLMPLFLHALPRARGRRRQGLEESRVPLLEKRDDFLPPPHSESQGQSHALHSRTAWASFNRRSSILPSPCAHPGPCHRNCLDLVDPGVS